MFFLEDLTLKLKVLTPMFLAGADGQTVELRPSSIKGMLRFWWRVTQAGTQNLRQREAEIFGTGGKSGGRSSFSMQITTGNLDDYRSRDPLPVHYYEVHAQRFNILKYLAYGTFERQYVKPDFEFELKFLLLDSARRDDLLEALWPFCLFGTLGAKSRNGFGSFQVLDVAGSLATPAFKAQVSLPPDKKTMGALCTNRDVPEFSGFSRKARLYKTTNYWTRNDCLTWDNCLAELAYAYRSARLGLENPHHYNQRQYIGSPIVVQKHQESDLDRRAKPYFLRVHKHNGKYQGFILYLPSHYLPPQYCASLAVGETKYQGLSLPKENASFLTACDNFNQSLSGDLGVVF